MRKATYRRSITTWKSRANNQECSITRFRFGECIMRIGSVYSKVEGHMFAQSRNMPTSRATRVGN